ncbi:hypothetical protein QQX98_008819 [Neonectria punicea]|uniref:Xylanolytic transcriptional activator regulatory domain-containing protein n=1 Tax=Neonectria punicea TaxID=979145 RepID=A0ABR1GUE3_9HYPO
MEYHPPPMTMTSQYRDVVDRGILPIGTATKLLERYNSKMLQHLPAVVLPPQISITELRHTKPILFLSLVAASSAEMPTLQRQLATELMEILAEKVFIRSEKSLEIVQALHLAVVWYWMPGYFEDMDFYRLVYIGAVMAIDIGLGQDTQGMKATASYQRRNYASPPPDPTTIESRRTWLTCYFLAASTSMTFHRPNLVQWTPFLAECVSVLENSPDAAPTDKYFCHMVWTHHLAEEVLLDFSMGDPMTVLDITDLRARCFLRVLERSLEEYASPIPQGLMQPTLRMTLHVVSLRMHEIALNCEAKEDMKPPFDTATLKEGMLREESLTPSHVNALSSCLTAISGIFETFLGMDLDSIRSLPAFSFARVAYAITILVRIGLSAMKPNSELGKIANNESMKVTYYLDRLLHKFSDAAADNRCRSVVKFLAVVDMLRSWFLEQVEGHNPAS